MKIKHYILPVLLFLASIASGQTTKTHVTLDGTGKIPIGQIPSGAGVIDPFAGEQPVWEHLPLSYTPPFVDDTLFATTGGYYYKRVLFDGVAHFRWWDIRPSYSDNYPATQRATYRCIAAGYVPGAMWDHGTYSYHRGIVVRKGAIGGPSEFVTFSLYGVGPVLDNTLGAGTRLQMTANGKDAAMIYLQKGLKCTIKNLDIIGQNSGIEAFSMADVFREKDGLITNGVAANQTGPHAGIVMDPFYSSAVGYKYPDEADKYTENSNVGGSQNDFININMGYWVVGICISPNGLNNGDHITIDHCSFRAMRTCVSTGSVQNINVVINFPLVAGKVLYAFDSKSFSPGGAGCPMTVTNFVFAAGLKWVFKVGSFYSNTSILMNGHAEELYGIGGCFEGRSTDIVLRDCRINFAASQYRPDDPGLIRSPHQIAQADHITVQDCFFTFGGKPQSFMGWSANSTDISGGSTNIPFVFPYGSDNTISGTRINASIGSATVGRYNGLSQTEVQEAIYVASIDTVNNRWTFVSTNVGQLAIGRFVRVWDKTNDFWIQGGFSFPAPMEVGAGTITSIVGTTVTVTGVPVGLTVGNFFDAHFIAISIVDP